MEINEAVESLAALAQESRLAIYRLLVQAGPLGMSAGKIAERLGLAPATLSFHLALLARAGLVRPRREGRFVYYSADFAATNQLVGFLTENCCGGQPELCEQPAPRGVVPARPRIHPKSAPMTERSMTGKVYNVLFLCTGNSARSVLAEALLNNMGRGRFNAYSAGSHPTGKVNPFALGLLEKNRLPTEGLRSKGWEEFARPGSPPLDFVFTVCDNAAGEVCPIWPGQPVTAHWGVEDPAAVLGSDEVKHRAFFKAYSQLLNRISLFLALPIDKLDRLALQSRLEEIGKAATEERVK